MSFWTGAKAAWGEVYTVAREIFASEAGRRMFERTVVRKLEEDPRPDVMRVIRRLYELGDETGNDEYKVAGRRLQDLLDRAERTSEPDLENNVVLALGHVLPRDKDGQLDEEEAILTYRWIAQFSYPEFAVFVRGMTHDPFAQYFREYILRRGPRAFRQLFDQIRGLARQGFEALETSIAQAHGVANIQEAAQQVAQWTAAVQARTRRPISKWNVPERIMRRVDRWLDI